MKLACDSEFILVWCKVHQGMFQTMAGSESALEGRCTACAIREENAELAGE